MTFISAPGSKKAICKSTEKRPSCNQKEYKYMLTYLIKYEYILTYEAVKKKGLSCLKALEVNWYLFEITLSLICVPLFVYLM